MSLPTPVHDYLATRSKAYADWHNNPSRNTHHWIVFILFSVLVTSLTLGGINQVNASYDATTALTSQQSVRDLTNQLLKQAKDYMRASDADKSTALAALTQTAAARRAALEQEILQTPKKARLDFLPDQLVSQLPSAISQYLEAKITVDGTLTIAHGDDFTGGRGMYYYNLRDASGKDIKLSVADFSQNIRGGSKVRVSGERNADGSLVEAESFSVLEAGSGGTTVSSGTTLAQTNNTVLVILANFNNTTAPSYTTDQAIQVMSTNSNSVANLYKEMSYGNQTMSVTVTPTWVTMNLAATCSYTSIASAANTAAQAIGLNPSNYGFVVYLFPGQSCGWAGLAYVGSPHQAFINGTGSFATKVVSHEMGHNFGLYHAGSLSCGSSTIGGTCSVSEYGDPWDTMGNQRAMHFDAEQKLLLGWIPSSSVVTKSSGSGSYTLSPLETAGASVYAVKIPTSNANRTYWLEYRQPIGFDAPIGSYPNNGPIVHVARPFEWSSGSDDTEIVDMTPGSAGGFGDAVLSVGQTYTDSSTGVTLSTVSAASTSTAVQLSFGPQACVPAQPTMSLSPVSQTSLAGGALVYTLSITNTDSVGCSGETYTFTPSLPAGWSSSLSNSSVTVSSGASANTTLTVTSPSGTTDGSYGITAQAQNAAATENASAQGTYVVFTPVVDTTPPTVLITSPANGSTISGIFANVAVTASDNIRVTKVEIYVDGVLKVTDTATPYTYKWNIKKAASGSHTISAKAYDAAGNTASASVTVIK